MSADRGLLVRGNGFIIIPARRHLIEVETFSSKKHTLIQNVAHVHTQTLKCSLTHTQMPAHIAAAMRYAAVRAL